MQAVIVDVRDLIEISQTGEAYRREIMHRHGIKLTGAMFGTLPCPDNAVERLLLAIFAASHNHGFQRRLGRVFWRLATALHPTLSEWRAMVKLVSPIMLRCIAIEAESYQAKSKIRWQHAFIIYCGFLLETSVETLLGAMIAAMGRGDVLEVKTDIRKIPTDE